MGLSTIIGRENRDAGGQKIDTAMHSRLERLRTLDFRTRMRTLWGQKFCEGFRTTRETKGKTKIIRCHS